MYKNILIPTDGVRTCESAIAHGVELAKAIGAKVTALHTTPKLSPHEILEIYQPGIITSDAEGKRAQAAMEHVEELHKHVADESLGAIEKIADKMGVQCEKVFIEGKAPADAITQTAEDKGCDLIFMSTHGALGLAGAIFGTVTTKVLSHAKVPVLVNRCDQH
jgi:nucleotide-binding universal stress UspA family protein